MSESLVGRTFGAYRLISLVGEGGMGQVHRAWRRAAAQYLRRRRVRQTADAYRRAYGTAR